MGLLEGKKAIITGGSRGIGRALCEVFAREGADIAFNYNVSDDRAAATVDKIQSYGRRALSYKVSVTDRPGIYGHSPVPQGHDIHDIHGPFRC